MIESYFFIPANKSRFINKIPHIKADYFILDFEDSLNNDLETAFSNVGHLTNREKYWVRPLLFSNEDKLQVDILKRLIDLKFTKFVLPKIKSHADLLELSKISFPDHSEFIILIESAEAYVNISEILSLNKLNITGISLGSHDFFKDLNMRYSLENLKRFREDILIHAKAFGVKPIDIASMDIKDLAAFQKETLFGFEMGYRSKFFLHPDQLDSVKKILLYNEEEIAFVKKVLKRFPNLSNEIGVLNIDGQILEKPHVKRILEIKKWVELYEAK